MGENELEVENGDGDADGRLLRRYAADRSQQAFARLVQRHVDLVYAAARRQCFGDAHLAEDVTQAVFMILARKPTAVYSGAVLPAWLLATTRYAASNALKLEARRRRHEREAAAMAQQIQPDDTDATRPADAALALSLDAALARLGEKDRSAVTMRFLQGRSLREVGAAMGVSEEAAQKRVSRAIDKLRAFFARRGVTMESAALASGIARQGATVAPATLAPLVVAHAMSAATAATAATAAATIAQAAGKSIVAAKVKLAGTVAASVAALTVTAAGVVAVSQRPPIAGAPATPATLVAAAVAPSPLWTQPAVGQTTDVTPQTSVAFSNAMLVPTYFSDTTQYNFGADPSVRRTPRSDPAVFIASLTPQATTMGAQGMLAIAMPYRGKRVRLSAYLKAKDVERSAAVQALVMGSRISVGAIDVQGEPVVQGTTDWVRCSSVIDVADDATQIQFAAALRGPGTVWIDGFELAVVPSTVPTTDDTAWHVFTPFPGRYVAAPDSAISRDGHATVRLNTDDAVAARRGEFGAFMRRVCAPELEPFLGHRMRVTALIKSDRIVGSAGLFASASHMGALAQSAKPFRPPPPVKGDLAWMRYAIEVDVPHGTDAVEVGVVIQGSGRVWIDDIQLEPVSRAASAAAAARARPATAGARSSRASSPPAPPRAPSPLPGVAGASR